MKLMDDIEQFINSGIGGWTSVAKAQTFAALILSYRPMVSVELGCWMGRGAISLALAHKEIGRGMCYAIDAWSPVASAEGQDDINRKHWAESDHEIAYKTMQDYVARLAVQNTIKVIRAKTNEAPMPEGIGFLIIDANHGDEAIGDVKRWVPKVLTGGFVYMDDLDWSGGAVRRAEAQLKSMGFRELYPIETGALYQRL